MTEIDAVVAIGLFLVFFSWSLIYYSDTFLQDRADLMQYEADAVSGKVAGYLSVDFYSVPVIYESGDTVFNGVLYLDYAWPSAGAMNSTAVYGGGSLLPCRISSGRLYFKSNVTQGKNSFTITYSDPSEAMNCDDALSLTGANRTEAWSAIKGGRLSQSRINNMTNTSYGLFKSIAGIDSQFMAEVNMTGSVTEYGQVPPNGTNVYVKTSRHAAEGGGEAILRVLVWQ